MFDFYKNLSEIEKKQYDKMLISHYMLLMTDLAYFIEKDENDELKFSASWIYSLPNTLKLFDYDIKGYPTGSISANRFYYQALRNFLGGEFPKTEGFNKLRVYLKNYLQLRRDDNVINPSFCFGSFYSINEDRSGKNRMIKTNLRHTVNALWLLIENDDNSISNYTNETINYFFNTIQPFLNKENIWKKETYKFLTLSSIINSCNSIINKSKDTYQKSKAKDFKDKAFSLILDKEILIEDNDIYFNWKHGNEENSDLKKMQFYDFYLIFFTLFQAPELLKNENIQIVVKGIIENGITSKYGFGIPIYKLSNPNRNNISADFGTSSGLLVILHYYLENNIGDSEWQSYCIEHFYKLLKFCLNTFDKKEFYHLSNCENNSRILLLPNFSLSKSKLDIYNKYLICLRNYILKKQGNSIWFWKSHIPTKYLFIKRLIDLWHVEDYFNSKKGNVERQKINNIIHDTKIVFIKNEIKIGLNLPDINFNLFN